MTPMMFRMIKEGITEMMVENLRTYRDDMSIGQYGTCTLTFKDFRRCGVPEIFGVKNPTNARGWITYMKCAQMMSFYA